MPNLIKTVVRKCAEKSVVFVLSLFDNTHIYLTLRNFTMELSLGSCLAQMSWRRVREHWAIESVYVSGGGLQP